MPCTDHYTNNDYSSYEISRLRDEINSLKSINYSPSEINRIKDEINSIKSTNNKLIDSVELLKKRLDNATKLLCKTCKHMEEVDKDFFEKNKDVKDWWEQHKKEDLENVRKSALAKLTKEEKDALGLK